MKKSKKKHKRQPSAILAIAKDRMFQTRVVKNRKGHGSYKRKQKYERSDDYQGKIIGAQ